MVVLLRTDPEMAAGSRTTLKFTFSASPTSSGPVSNTHFVIRPTVAFRNLFFVPPPQIFSSSIRPWSSWLSSLSPDSGARRHWKDDQLVIARRLGSVADKSSSASPDLGIDVEELTSYALPIPPFKKELRIADVKGSPDGGIGRVGEQLVLRGWVRTCRLQKSFSFIEINDGSCVSNFQAVLASDIEGHELIESGQIATGASVVIEGMVVESKGSKQKVELKAAKLVLVGGSDGATFPVQKKKITREFLRTIAHIRSRTNTFGAMIEPELAFADLKDDMACATSFLQQREKCIRRRYLISTVVLCISSQQKWSNVTYAKEMEKGTQNENNPLYGGVFSLFETTELGKSGRRLPKSYLKSARELVKSLTASINEDRNSIDKFRKSADAAKDAIRDYLSNNWKGSSAVNEEESYRSLEKALRVLGNFYRKSGPRAILTNDIKSQILEELKNADENL